MVVLRAGALTPPPHTPRITCPSRSLSLNYYGGSNIFKLRGGVMVGGVGGSGVVQVLRYKSAHSFYCHQRS